MVLWIKNADRNSTAVFLVFIKENREDGLEVRVHDEDIWMMQKSMAQLFDCFTDNIGLHFKNIFASGELDAEAVTEKSSATASHGKKYMINYMKDKNGDNDLDWLELSARRNRSPAGIGKEIIYAY